MRKEHQFESVTEYRREMRARSRLLWVHRHLFRRQVVAELRGFFYVPTVEELQGWVRARVPIRFQVHKVESLISIRFRKLERSRHKTPHAHEGHPDTQVQSSRQAQH